jgi:hypothetical protein
VPAPSVTAHSHRSGEPSDFGSFAQSPTGNSAAGVTSMGDRTGMAARTLTLMPSGWPFGFVEDDLPQKVERGSARGGGPELLGDLVQQVRALANESGASTSVPVSRSSFPVLGVVLLDGFGCAQKQLTKVSQPSGWAK